MFESIMHNNKLYDYIYDLPITCEITRVSLISVKNFFTFVQVNVSKITKHKIKDMEHILITIIAIVRDHGLPLLLLCKVSDGI